jgi:hypothetical protein
MFVTSLTKHERTPHRALKSSNAPGQLWSCPTRVARTHTPKDRYRDYHSPYSRLCSTNCLYIPAYQSAARPSRVPVTGHQGRGAMTCLRAGNLRQARFAFRGRGLAALRSHSRCLSLALQRTSPERVSSPRPASPDIAIRRTAPHDCSAAKQSVSFQATTHVISLSGSFSVDQCFASRTK